MKKEKSKFDKYHYVSIVLFATIERVRINKLSSIDLNEKEWIGKSDTAVEISIDEMEKNIFDTIIGIIKKCR